MQASFEAYLETVNIGSKSFENFAAKYFYAGWRAAGREAQERLYDRMRPGIDVV